MKTRTLQLAFIAALLVIGPAPGLAKDFAPCAPRSQQAIELNKTTGWDTCAGIPSQEAVGIPAIPDGQVASASVGGLNLPGITLLATSPYEDVVDFYKKALTEQDGWKWNETLSIFYRGDSVDGALALTSPSVRISQATDVADGYFLVDKAFRDTVKTTIEIHYKPVRAAAASPGGRG